VGPRLIGEFDKLRAVGLLKLGLMCSNF